MFMIFSLLSASVDGFVSGFVIGTAGIRLKPKEIILSFSIIFICCLGASVSGNILAQTSLGQFINILGVAVMRFLAYTAYTGKIEQINANSRITTISLSVAADAAVACLYLAMCGYNILAVSAISAFLHCTLMVAGSKISNRIAENHPVVYARNTRAVFFMLMAITKLYEIF